MCISVKRNSFYKLKQSRILIVKSLKALKVIKGPEPIHVILIATATFKNIWECKLSEQYLRNSENEND